MSVSLATQTVIREATEADIHALVTLGMAFLRESVYAAHIGENPAQAEKVARYLLEHPDGAVLVADVDGSVVGMIGLMVVPHLFSGELTAGEVFYFVSPEHRGSAGVRLLGGAEAWAKEHGAAQMQMIAPTARVCEFYERMGFTEIERNFQKRI